MGEQRLRILFISDVTSAHNHNWVRYLTRMGHEIVFLSVRPGQLDGVEVIYVEPGDKGPKWLRMLAQLKFLWREWRLISSGNFDIVHAHFLRADAIGFVATLHPRSVISLWGSDARLPNDGGDPRRMWLRRRALERTAIVTVPNGFLEDCARRISPRINRIEIIPFGVHLDVFKPNETVSVSNSDPKDADKTCFLFAKPRLINLYGIDVLLKSFSDVSKKYPNAVLYIAGKGEPEQIKEFKTLIQQHNIEQQVIFTGACNREQIADLMRQCDILVQPSRWESFGVVMLEGMAMGLPVISTKVGGVPELVRDGVTGLIVPPGNVDALTEAMLTLIMDKTKCQEFGTNGRKMVRELYDFNFHGGRMNKLYHELVGVNHQ